MEESKHASISSVLGLQKDGMGYEGIPPSMQGRLSRLGGLPSFICLHVARHTSCAGT